VSFGILAGMISSLFLCRSHASEGLFISPVLNDPFMGFIKYFPAFLFFLFVLFLFFFSSFLFLIWGGRIEVIVCAFSPGSAKYL